MPAVPGEKRLQALGIAHAVGHHGLGPDHAVVNYPVALAPETGLDLLAGTPQKVFELILGLVHEIVAPHDVDRVVGDPALGPKDRALIQRLSVT